MTVQNRKRVQVQAGESLSLVFVYSESGHLLSVDVACMPADMLDKAKQKLDNGDYTSERYDTVAGMPIVKAKQA